MAMCHHHLNVKGSVVASGLAIAGGISVWSIQRPMKPEQQVQQLNAVVNLKQLALALNVYAADYDEVYPNVRDLRSLKVVTYPYVKDKAAWHTDDPDGQIRFDFGLGGVARKDVKEPAATVMFYESKPWPDGRRGVSFSDGRARLLDAHEWAEAAKSMFKVLPKKAGPLPESIGRAWKDE